MSFANDVMRFRAKLERRRHDLYVGTATSVHGSVKFGSPVTGAPGQPVQTSTLLNSWQLAIGPTEATISTNVLYAPAIEDGVGPHGPLTLRSTVGGFHSVKLTVAGGSAIQADVLRGMGE